MEINDLTHIRHEAQKLLKKYPKMKPHTAVALATGYYRGIMKANADKRPKDKLRPRKRPKARRV